MARYQQHICVTMDMEFTVHGASDGPAYDDSDMEVIKIEEWTKTASVVIDGVSYPVGDLPAAMQKNFWKRIVAEVGDDEWV